MTVYTPLAQSPIFVANQWDRKNRPWALNPTAYNIKSKKSKGMNIEENKKLWAKIVAKDDQMRLFCHLARRK